MDVKSFFIRYLLFPLIFVVSAAIMAIINKKNKFLNNKRLIVYVLLTAIVLALPGFLGMLGFDFMPWGYIISQIYYLGMGCLTVFLFTKHYPTELIERKFFIFFALLIAALLGIYLYQLAFNWLSELKMGLWGATAISVYFLPLVFWWTYVAFISIPTEIYKIWQYPPTPLRIDMEHLDFDRLLVLELELYKNTNDAEPLKVKVKAPENMNFGIWFHKFIDDYNLKFPKSPIEFRNDENQSYKWMFFVKTSFFRKNLFLDPDLDITRNGINEKMTIYAKRVSENVAMTQPNEDQAVFI
ncbi:TssN family type VI secretion system protein [Pedobacter sp. SYP-B3415]|uniref:TssN family type VI secretion system protein n=1 Tax=Pedobacter sp. SYP-B3415 TaxID=2496641 RepID=UPI00101C6C77|nr:TssN family type VI secretion system protein [Pedobacter sp. SYP-B3415]